jgi:hypothetical protein
MRMDLVVQVSGTLYYIDVSCVQPLAAHNRARDASDSGNAIAARAIVKHKLYDAYAREARARLVPFVCDVYGRLGAEAMSFVRGVMAHRAAAAGRARRGAVYAAYALARLSVAIQVGNARAAAAAIQKLRSEQSSASAAAAAAPPPAARSRTHR